jgi:hypothetical protein
VLQVPEINKSAAAKKGGPRNHGFSDLAWCRSGQTDTPQCNRRNLRDMNGGAVTGRDLRAPRVFQTFGMVADNLALSNINDVFSDVDRMVGDSVEVPSCQE